MSDYAARPWLKHYDYWIRPPLTYPTRPLHEILSTTATEMPDARATAFLGATLTFDEIRRRADRLSAALLRLGITKGDRVGSAAGAISRREHSGRLHCRRAPRRGERARRSCANPDG